MKCEICENDVSLLIENSYCEYCERSMNNDPENVCELIVKEYPENYVSLLVVDRGFIHMEVKHISYESDEIVVNNFHEFLQYCQRTTLLENEYITLSRVIRDESGEIVNQFEVITVLGSGRSC